MPPFFTLLAARRPAVSALLTPDPLTGERPPPFLLLQQTPPPPPPPAPQAQHLQLALCFQQSMPPLLSAPGAASDPPGLPVALASSPMVADHTAQHTLVAFTEGVLATLVELVR